MCWSRFEKIIHFLSKNRFPNACHLYDMKHIAHVHNSCVRQNGRQGWAWLHVSADSCDIHYLSWSQIQLHWVVIALFMCCAYFANTMDAISPAASLADVLDQHTSFAEQSGAHWHETRASFVKKCGLKSEGRIDKDGRARGNLVAFQWNTFLSHTLIIITVKPVYLGQNSALLGHPIWI